MEILKEHPEDGILATFNEADIKKLKQYVTAYINGAYKDVPLPIAKLCLWLMQDNSVMGTKHAIWYGHEVSNLIKLILI